MEYNEEELLELLNQVIHKNVSYESTSVPYEKAQILMDGILYHVEECFTEKEKLWTKTTPLEVLYHQGIEMTKEKVYQAKEIYLKVQEDFQDYHVRNYRDTVVKGMPGFFVRYDLIYEPQNHILTLDYPVLFPTQEKRGVDLILDYMENIQIEKEFLEHFPPEAVMQVLEETVRDYKNNYMDNITYAVLRQALFCMIAGKSVEALQITEGDKEEVQEFFLEDGKEKGIFKAVKLLEIMEQRMSLKEGYFIPYAPEFYFRLLS